ncbi:hypothetical protein NL676_029385 [Syzygium grande]|nr:hypothetical protein NL676_029385 [Syzygium grande]
MASLAATSSRRSRASIYEGGRRKMTPERIRMAVGAERLEGMLGGGSEEEEEMLLFEDDAFLESTLEGTTFHVLVGTPSLGFCLDFAWWTVDGSIFIFSFSPILTLANLCPLRSGNLGLAEVDLERVQTPFGDLHSPPIKDSAGALPQSPSAQKPLFLNLRAIARVALPESPTRAGMDFWAP